MKAQGHITVRRRPKDGDNGSNAFRLDLNNENDSLLYDAEGNLLSGSVVSVATLYDGDAAVSSGVVFAISERVGCTAAQATISGNTITVSGLSGSGYVMVTATYNNKTYSAKFTLKRLVGTVKYDLLVTPDAIAYNTTTGTKSASTINVKIYRTAQNNSGGVSRTLMTSVPTGYTLKVDGTNVANYGSSGYTFNVNTSQNSHVVSLYQSSTLVDEETVPINKSTNGSNGSDGNDGNDGRGIVSTTIEYQASNSGTTVPTGTWQLNVPSVAQGQYLWTRTTIKYTSGSDSVGYSVARFGSDGQDGTNGTNGRDGSQGPQGPTGPQGIQGCIYRISVWENGKEYRNDEALTSGTRYVDVVVKTGISVGSTSSIRPYECKLTHTATSAREPGTGSSWGSYWDEMSYLTPMMTPLLLAQTISADYINVASLASNAAFISYLAASTAFIDALTVKHLDTTPSSTGNKVKIDGNEVDILDSSGNKKVRLFNGSIGGYDDMILSASADYTSSGITRTKTIAKYIPSSGTTYYETAVLANLNLGYFNVGDSIYLSKFNFSMTVPSMVSTGNAVTAVFNAPSFVIEVLRDGTVVSTTYMTPSSSSYGSGSSVSANAYPYKTINITTAGNYSIRISPASNGFGFSGNTSSGDINYTPTVKLYFRFSRSNYQYTHIGNDGMIQVFGSGFLFNNSDTFVVRKGSFMLRVNSSGVAKSTNTGESWTSL